MSTLPELTEDEIAALLPFLANDTLEGAEREAVQAAVDAAPSLQQELEALKSMRGQMQAEEVSSPGEFGLARLMRDIEAEQRELGKMQAAPQRSNIWKLAAAAAVALFAVQTVFVWNTGGDTVELAGGGSQAATGVQLTVAFVPDATEAEIRNQMLSLGLRIVGGPTALGLYTLSAQDQTSAERAVRQLNGLDTLVESAELTEGGQ